MDLNFTNSTIKLFTLGITTNDSFNDDKDGDNNHNNDDEDDNDNCNCIENTYMTLQ